jgi:hypothetical protein
MLQNKNEVLDTIIDGLMDYEGSDFETYEEETFNQASNIYTREAALDLDKFVKDDATDYEETTLDNGAFAAIQLVKAYEQDNFGEINTDLTDPCKVADMVDYIRGTRVFEELLSEADFELDDEITEESAKKVIKLAKEA